MSDKDKKKRKDALYCFIRNGSKAEIEAQQKKVMQLQSEINTNAGTMSILKKKKDGTEQLVESKLSIKKLNEYTRALKKLEYLKAPSGVTFAGVFVKPNVIYIGRSKKFEGGRVLEFDPDGYSQSFVSKPPDVYSKEEAKNKAYSAAIKLPQFNNNKSKIAIIEIANNGKGIVRFFLEICELLHKMCKNEETHRKLMANPLKYKFEPEEVIVQQ